MKSGGEGAASVVAQRSYDLLDRAGLLNGLRGDVYFTSSAARQRSAAVRGGKMRRSDMPNIGVPTPACRQASRTAQRRVRRIVPCETREIFPRSGDPFGPFATCTSTTATSIAEAERPAETERQGLAGHNWPTRQGTCGLPTFRQHSGRSPVVLTVSEGRSESRIN